MKAHVSERPTKPGGAELARSASLSWHSPPCGSVLDVVVLVVIVVVVLLFAAAFVVVVLWKRKLRNDAAKEQPLSAPVDGDQPLRGLRLFQSKHTSNTLYKSGRAKKGSKRDAAMGPSAP